MTSGKCRRMYLSKCNGVVGQSIDQALYLLILIMNGSVKAGGWEGTERNISTPTAC